MNHLNIQLQETVKRQRELEELIIREKINITKRDEKGSITKLSSLIDDQNKHLDQEISNFKTPRNLANIRFDEQKTHYIKMNKQDHVRYKNLVYPLKDGPTRTNECFTAILGILIKQDERIRRLECERSGTNSHTATFPTSVDHETCQKGFVVNKN